MAVFNAARDTWYVYADNVASAANKIHLGVFNAVGSGKVVKIRKLFHINLALAAITGVGVRYDVKKTTAQTGVAITPVAADTTQAALPAQVTAVTTGTVTEGAILFPITRSNDEVGATGAFPESAVFQSLNLMPEGNEVREFTLQEGQGLAVKQITSTVVGTSGWLAVVTIE